MMVRLVSKESHKLLRVQNRKKVFIGYYSEVSLPRSINTVLLRCSRKQVTFDQTGSKLKKQPNFLAMIAPLQLKHFVECKICDGCQYSGL